MNSPPSFLHFPSCSLGRRFMLCYQMALFCLLYSSSASFRPLSTQVTLEVKSDNEAAKCLYESQTFHPTEGIQHLERRLYF